MSETRPKIRLVCKEQYRQMMRKVAAQYVSGSIQLLLGAGGLLLTVALMGFDVVLDKSWDFHSSDWDCIFTILMISLIVGVPSVLFLESGKRLYSDADRTAASIAPITDQNAHFLSDQETLLRGSDLPPTLQQAELLRATQTGQGTPQEQLLRSPTGEE